jgi:hypothetical protein
MTYSRPCRRTAAHTAHGACPGTAPEFPSERVEFVTGSDPGDCPVCAPFACDDPDRHLGVPSEYTPLANRGCRCGADLDGRDCMCFE